MAEVITYHFQCACRGAKCARKSEALGEEYGRLSTGQQWYSEECAEAAEEAGNARRVRPFKGGFIMEEVDF